MLDEIFYHDDYQLESKIFSIPEDELETETTESIDENKEIVENIDLETCSILIWLKVKKVKVVSFMIWPKFKNKIGPPLWGVVKKSCNLRL